MDFTSQYHQPDSFSAAQQEQQYGQFVSIPPLSPTEDYRNRSPPNAIDGLPYNQFQNINYDAHHQSFPNQTNFSGPPTPPTNGVSTQHQSQQHLQQQNHGYDAPNVGVVAAVQPSSSLADNGGDGGINSGRGDAGSEDDEPKGPAQLRRKAQNRAAQRAFRERKERHVKDLETKIASLEDAAKESSAEIERLKRDLQKTSTENEILRATSRATDPRNLSPRAPEESMTFSGPKSYKPTDFYTTVLETHENKQPSHRILTDVNGEQLLGVAAAWDLIAQHEAFQRGDIDMVMVSDELKPLVKCDGQGPVFAKSDVLRAVKTSIEQSTGGLL